MRNRTLSNLFNKRWFWILLIFAMAMGIRIYRVSQKEGLFLDEGASITLSAYNEYGVNRNFDENVVYNGREVRNLLLWGNDSYSNALKNIIHLRQNNRDPSHTNLYYSTLRLWFAGVKTNDIHRIIIRGFCLNSLFFIFSFFFMYKLSKKLFSNSWLIAFTLILAYLNPGSIMNTLYLREYQMQETLLVLITYLFVNYYYLIKDNRSIDSWKSMLKIAILVSFVLLSGYFTIFYVVILGLILLYTSYKNGQRQNILFLIFTFLVAFAFVGTLYCKYYDGFFGHESTEALGKLDLEGLLKNISVSAKKYLIDIRSYLISVPAFAFFIIIIIKVIIIDSKKAFNRDKIALRLSICGIIWSGIIMFFAPFKGVHYMMSIFPIIILAVPFITSYLKRKEMLIAILIFVTIFSIKAVTRKEVYYGFLPIEKVYQANKNLPVIVSIEGWGYYPALLSYFSDDRQFEFPHSLERFQTNVNKYERVMVIVSQTRKFKEQYHIPDGYTIDQHFQCNWFFDGYILQKNNKVQNINIK